ncbi:MAG: hypothetical protein IPM29_15455 [Planctomycetes bacterium]|nr:hypothetical protein [Planctomycetota bacterium]
MRTYSMSGGTLGPRGGLFIYLPGATLVALGVMILWMPELLRYLVAGLLLLVGAVLLVAARQMRTTVSSPTGIFTAVQQRLRRPFGG